MANWPETHGYDSLIGQGWALARGLFVPLNGYLESGYQGLVATQRDSSQFFRFVRNSPFLSEKGVSPIEQDQLLCVSRYWTTSAELDRVEQTLQQIPAQGEQAWTVHRFARGEDSPSSSGGKPSTCWILDWQLPDLSGLQLLRWSREHLDAPPPAIMLTSRDAEQDIVQALNSGADDYVSKPFGQTN